ncbi:hypothetical protein PGH12_01530 [Chryseobacterium wangxinyae]|uniref:DUF6705 family protein n=1 Tax=Chryseobacterium sp. CY350 TaxID=2997336 RepID=UPI0022705CCC|nr:DUF6705 family protein [Chryseobacterium sp. CY350]MCY0977138.1 hypothetical protein [Chryseobacterium sp. CY350]WBZ95842.1 hypothetical protein PGH12_01530 [Chryseobacterium sp. CY350]
MKKIITLTILLLFITCKAQIYPLKTDYSEVPINSYLKDINNELDLFVGNYTSQFQGRNISINISKIIHHFFDGSQYKYYQDILSLKYTVSNSSGTILQSTENLVFPSNQLQHTIYSQWVENNGNTLLLYYGGTNCGIGWGQIKLKYINPTQISWDYEPNSTVVGDNCPTNINKTVYLPLTTDLIFTKQ